MFPRSYVFNFLLLAGLAVAGFGANQPSSPPDYTGLYDFDTVAGSPIAGLRNNDAYYEPGQLERVAYQSPGATVSYQS